MVIQPDFRDLLALLKEHSVDFVVVGALALAQYGTPRLTGDMDVLVRPEQENALRVMAALEQFGFGSVGINVTDILDPNKVVQLGFDPVRIDIMSEISGVSWDAVWAGKEPGKYGDVAVFFIGKREFVANKKAIGRPKDLGDISVIGES